MFGREQNAEKALLESILNLESKAALSPRKTTKFV
jgi:hypothetical protein